MEIRMRDLAVALALMALGACTETSETQLTGRWEGYVEDSGRLQSEGVSSDRIVVDISALEADGKIAGTISFGETGTLALPTDPNEGYPAGLSLELSFGPWPYVEKFSYALTGSYDSSTRRLQGSRNYREVWTQWCELQTSYESDDRYGCLPNCGAVQNADACELLCEAEERIPVDCGQLALCNDLDPVCDCGPGGCSVAGSAEAVLDLHMDGNELQGELFGLGDVFLVKQ